MLPRYRMIICYINSSIENPWCRKIVSLKPAFESLIILNMDDKSVPLHLNSRYEGGEAFRLVTINSLTVHTRMTVFKCRDTFLGTYLLLLSLVGGKDFTHNDANADRWRSENIWEIFFCYVMDQQKRMLCEQQNKTKPTKPSRYDLC